MMLRVFENHYARVLSVTLRLFANHYGSQEP